MTILRTSGQLTRVIKDKALELGFDLVGIAPATRFPEVDGFRSWLAKGYAGEMGYLARNIEKREDCRVLFPPARSVIVCGMSYHSLPASPVHADTARHGKIARYARGDDYHEILKALLYHLLEFIQQETPSTRIQFKVCVDTVPIFERLYARYAGLGWIGKNGALIHPRYGSWIFLGEIILNLDLAYDTPLPDQCGSCTRCLDACPSGALLGPHTLDARRCLSYLTIEHRGEIPEALRAVLGSIVFGCDRCQDVCPWNQDAKPGGHPAFLPRAHCAAPELSWLAALTSDEFSRVFRRSPIARATWQGLLRNTVVTMGNSGNPAFVPVLKALENSSPDLVRRHIPWALARLSGSL